MPTSNEGPIDLRIGHSPDPDDAFMWWPLTCSKGFDTGRFRFEPVLADIETLNRRAELEPGKTLEITALSCAQYPFVRDRYALTDCGTSMGERYGPKIVSLRPMALDDLKTPDVVIAVPGERTTAFATICLMLGKDSFRHAVVPFEQIIGRVRSGEFAAGLIIHEGQLTFEQAGLHLIEDVGAWWWRRHKLPLPLGVNAIRRDLDSTYGGGTIQEVAGVLRRSVEFAMAHRADAVGHAMGYARDMDASLADRFIQMYVNARSLSMGAIGSRAVRTFLTELEEAELAPAAGSVDILTVGDQSAVC